MSEGYEETPFILGTLGLNGQEVESRLRRPLTDEELVDVEAGRIESLIAVRRAIIYHASVILDKPIAAANYKVALDILEKTEKNKNTDFADDLIEI